MNSACCPKIVRDRVPRIVIAIAARKDTTPKFIGVLLYCTCNKLPLTTRRQRRWPSYPNFPPSGCRQRYQRLVPVNFSVPGGCFHTVSVFAETSSAFVIVRATGGVWLRSNTRIDVSSSATLVAGYLLRHYL